jgi:xanthine dehydrogenase YagS FAD-binding subunit
MRAFTYHRPPNIVDAIHLASITALAPTEAPVQFLAGGTTILDLMKLDTMRPAQLVDLGEVGRDFCVIRADGNGLHLGAFATMAETAAHPKVANDYPLIAQSLLLAASAQIRNMATLGGNVLQRTRCNYFRDSSWPSCNKRVPGSGCAALEGVNRKHAVLGTSETCIAAYAGDFAQALIALDALVEISGPGGAREIAFADLHQLPQTHPERETVLQPGDIITGFRVPHLPFARRSLYLKVRDRESYEFALASAAVVLDLEEDHVREARIALGGVATRPWRAHEAEAVLQAGGLSPVNLRRTADAAFAGAKGHGDNDYKIELGRRTLIRALRDAATMEA